MAKVITFSRTFPAYHHKKGQPTYFVEKFWKSLWDQNKAYDIHLFQEPNDNHFHPMGANDMRNVHEFKGKHHTIRAGHRFKTGDYFSPRVWSGKPYNSKQIIIADDVEVLKVFDFEISKHAVIYLNGKPIYEFCGEYTGLINTVAKNDGLEPNELLDWLDYPKSFDGQIICWNPEIKY